MHGGRRTVVLAILILTCLGGTSTTAGAAERQGPGGNGRNAEVSRVFATTDPTAVEGLPVGEWVSFQFGSAGSSTSEFHFEASGPIIVSVTDAYCRGDRFEVFDGAQSLGLTSQPAPADGCTEAATFDEGLANVHYSSGRFLLGAGNHALRFLAVESPYGAGRAGFRLTLAPVPGAAADCRNGAWRTLHRSDAAFFKNQGECMSSVLRRH